MADHRRHTYLFVAASFLLFVLVVWTLPLGFSSFLRGHSFPLFWYALSWSGGWYGSTLLVVGLGLLVAARSGRGLVPGAIAGLAVAVLIGVVLIAVALINERMIKPLAGFPRPSHLTLKKRGLLSDSVASFYSRSKAERRLYLQRNLKRHGAGVRDIHPRILAHWIYESGRSFPSGHALNSWLLGSLATYLLLVLLPAGRRWLGLAPMLWAALVAISRVVIGVHTPLDVTAGGLLGVVLATALIGGGVAPWFVDRFGVGRVSGQSLDI